MSDTKLLFQSFAGGEITPELYGRVDLGKFQTGLAKALNFEILPHGPAQNRSGTEYVLEAGDSAHNVRLIPFSFSADQTMALEFGHLYIRFHTAGGTLLDTAKNITAATQANPGVFTSAAHGYANGKVVYITGVGGMTEVNGRFFKIANTAANTFTLTLLDGTAVNTTAYTAYTAGGTVAAVYEITSTYDSADLFDLHFAQDSDVLTITSLSYPTRELARVSAVSWTLTSVSFAPTLAAPTGGAAAATVAVATNLTTQTYCVTAVAADGITETLASSTFTASNNLTLAGNYNTLSWTARAGASRYQAYKLQGGVLGYIGQTTGLSLVDDNVLPDTSKTPPEDLITLNTGANEYPQAVTYHEQRRWFGGTNANRQTGYATRNGTGSNLTSSLPSQDDDGMRFRIASQQQNAIRHLMPLNDLIAFTAGGVFRLFADGAPAITPSSLTVKPQGYAGASNVQPVLTSSTILYVQAQGSRVRELSYANDVISTYKSVDMSVMAPHLVDNYTLKDAAFSRAPRTCAWFTRSDGRMLGMTYLPEHQVYAWHQHSTTNGLFKSVACVAESNEDMTYFVVERVINARTVKMIERLARRFYYGTAKADAFFVDCGIQYSGAAITNITNLHHLEGQTVSILADGAVCTQQVVTNGRLPVALTTAATKISVGLPITADLETLPLSLQQAPAVGAGTIKNVDKVFLKVCSSTGVRVGPSFDKLVTIPMRSNEAYGTSPALRTGTISTNITPGWSEDGSVFIRNEDPVPLTILSMALGVSVGG